MDHGYLKSYEALCDEPSVAHLIAADAGLGFALLDIDAGLLRFADGSFRAFVFGGGERHLPLTTWLDRIHPEDRLRVGWVLDSLLVADAPQAQIECRLLGNDEQWYWIVLTGRIERDVAGKPARLHMCLRNTTEEHTIREQLRELAQRGERERDEDRALLARELHDELGQWLTAIRMDADRLLSLHRRDSALSASELSNRLTEIKNVAGDSIKAVQRICQELRPAASMELGLTSAIRSAADTFEARTGIRCRAALPEAELNLDPERCRVLCRALHEALTNVLRHAQASEVRVTLRDEADVIEMEIADNGRGLPPGVLSAPTSIGLFGLRERAQGLGGEATIASAPDSGTVVTLRVPREAAIAETQSVLV